MAKGQLFCCQNTRKIVVVPAAVVKQCDGTGFSRVVAAARVAVGGEEMVKKHLLVCPCGTEIAVSGGQAGGQVVCTNCQATVAVPKLRALSRLPLAPEIAAGPRGGWGLSQGMLLAGGLLAIACWGAAAWLGRTVESPVDPQAIRQNVAQQTDAQIYEAWKKHFSTTTVSRPQMVIEKQFAQQTLLRKGMAFALAGLGAVGAAIGIAGGIGLIQRRQ
jgi:hypothetical protein